MTSSLPDPRTLARALKRLYTPQEIARVAAPVSDAYRAFQAKYEHDPAGFIRDCVDWGNDAPASYQLDIATLIVDHDRAAARGPRGLGKSALAALLIHWWALVWDGREDWKAVTTASVWSQLTQYLWPEVRKWARRLRWDLIGRAPYRVGVELLQESLHLKTGEAFAAASNDPQRLEGGHATKLFYLFDEAKLIPFATWDSVEGAFSAGGKWLALSTPDPSGEPSRFYEIMTRASGYESWAVRHVTIQEALQAGRVDATWVEERRKAWARTPELLAAYVEGNFPEKAAGGLIPFTWIEEAQSRWKEWNDAGRPGKVTAIGFDVGGGLGGGDLSTIALVVDNRIVSEIRAIPKALDPSVATMELAGQVLGLCNAYQPRWVVGDVIGLGAGVVQRLRELGVGVIGFNAGEGTAVTDKSGEQGFMNWRAAGWWLLRELLEPESAIQIALPQDDELLGDLAAPRIKRRDSNNRIVIEAKDDIRKRIGRSTDRADAVIHALIGPALWLEAQEEGQSEVVYMGPNTKWY